jgi:hypothetical protein
VKGSLQQAVENILSDPINLPSPFLDYLIQYAAVNPIPSAAVSAPIVNSTGLQGATKASRLVGSTTSGAPTQGTFQKGDLVIAQDGHLWVCTGPGSPGTWVDAALSTVQASSVDFNSDIHLHSAGNTMEQASVLTLEGSVSNPSVAPKASWGRSGSLTAGVTYTIGYTWVDGGGHESALSPTVSVTGLPPTGGWQASLIIPALPTGVTGFHIYAGTGGGNHFRQAAPAYVTSETSTSPSFFAYNSGGASPPVASTFPTGTPAVIKDYNGNSLIAGDGTMHGTTITATGPTGGIGYAIGAGGTGTTSSGAVTINKVCGQITMESHTVNAGTAYTVTVTNSTVAATDTVVIVQASGGNIALIVSVTAVAAGSFNFTIRNVSAATNVDVTGMTLNYAVTKAVTS